LECRDNKSLKRIKEQNAVPPPLHHVGVLSSAEMSTQL
jgi:hypothetical protein